MPRKEVGITEQIMRSLGEKLLDFHFMFCLSKIEISKQKIIVIPISGIQSSIIDSLKLPLIFEKLHRILDFISFHTLSLIYLFSC